MIKLFFYIFFNIPMENKQPILTISLTTCYKTEIYKFRQMLKSLFTNFSLDIPTNSLINSNETRKHLKNVVNEFLNDDFDKYNFIYELPKEIIKQLKKNNFEDKIELLIIIDDIDHDKKSFLTKTNVNNIINEIHKINKIIHNYVEIKYVLTSKNIKISCARNIIIKESRGKYLKFSDDDDLNLNIISLINILLQVESEQKTSNKLVYISHYTHKDSYSYFEHTIKPQISNIGVCNGIYLTSFLKDNNLYFVPYLDIEDVIWRSNLNYYLTINNVRCKQINRIGYVYMDASNRSMNELNTRFLDDIDFNSYPLIKSTNEDYYENVNKILTQQLKLNFKMTDWRLFALSSSACFFKQYNLIYEWMNNNIQNLSDGYDKEMFNLIKKLDQEPEFEDSNTKNIKLFSALTVKDKKYAFEIFSKYITIPDLYSFAKSIDKNIILDIMNDVWKNEFNYIIYNKEILQNEYFEKFIYKFMHFINLQDETKYRKYINIKIRNKIKELYLNEIEYIPLNECLNFIHDRLIKMKNVVSNIENLFSNQKVKFEDLYEIIQNLVNGPEFDNERDKILELTNEFIKQNRLETTELHKCTIGYKGPMNVLQFYLFSIPLLNPLKADLKLNCYENSNIFQDCYEIKYCEKYYEKLKNKTNDEERNKLMRYFNSEDKINIIKNIHNYSRKEIKQLLKYKIKSKYLIKFNYEDIVWLYNNEIDLKKIDKIDNHFELVNTLNLIKQLKPIEEYIEILNNFQYINKQILARILTLKQLGFTIENIQKYISKTSIFDNLSSFNNEEFRYDYQQFINLNDKHVFYFQIDKLKIKNLFNVNHINIDFIKYIINSKCTLKQNYILNNNEIFDIILYIIDLFNICNINILEYDIDITNLNKLKFDLMIKSNNI